MKPRLQLALLIIGVLVPVRLTGPLLAQPPMTVQPRPDVTRQALFSIPFYVNQSALRPAEVHLYVSGDGGRTWSLYQRRQPNRTRFDFQAGQDGEYWFVVRTDDDVDLPNPSTQAEKIVIVDRADPSLSVEVSVGESGELIATYQADDANLDPTSFKMEYRLAEEDVWAPVPVDRRPSESLEARQHTSGRTSWVAGAPSGATDLTGDVEVRATIGDRAGNVAKVQKSFDLNPSTTRISKSHADPPSTDRDHAANPISSALPGEITRLPWLEDRVPAKEPSGPSPTTVHRPGENHTTERTSNPSSNPSGWRSIHKAWSRLPNAAPRIGNSLDRMPEASSPPLQPTDVATTSPHQNQAPSPRGDAPVPGVYAPPIANRVEAQEPPVRSDVPMTSSRRFNLDYDASGVGAGGAARVELWITDDDGSTWQPFGLDRDLTSPFLVELDREGVFGFRLLIHDQLGVSARPPQPGETADLRVGVDWTRPKAELLGAKRLEGQTTQAIRIEWRAEDPNLGSHPIRLSFAPHPEGPWSVIATDLANTGSYRWEPDHPLPSQFYLQLEVQDRAGNVTRDRMLDAVGSGSNGPTGIIRGLRPLQKSANSR